MKLELLRSKMALKGDYDLICLTAVTGLSKGAVLKKCNGVSEWKRDEIKDIAKFYELTNDEIVSIFNLMGDFSEDKRSS